MPVYKGWIIGTAAALVAAGGATIFFKRRGHALPAQVTTLLVLIYGLFVLMFWSMGSPALFRDLSRVPDKDAKILLLAGTAGLLAQIVIWLNRFAHDPKIDGRLLPMYTDAIMGLLCGAVGVALFAAVRTVTIGAVTDPQAAITGFGGGALGLGLVTAVKRWFPAIEEKAADSPAQRIGTCVYSGQEYSHGATLIMPTIGGGQLVKICDGVTGRWQVDGAAAIDTRERADTVGV